MVAECLRSKPIRRLSAWLAILMLAAAPAAARSDMACGAIMATMSSSGTSVHTIPDHAMALGHNEGKSAMGDMCPNMDLTQCCPGFVPAMRDEPLSLRMREPQLHYAGQIRPLSSANLAGDDPPPR